MDIKEEIRIQDVFYDEVKRLRAENERLRGELRRAVGVIDALISEPDTDEYGVVADILLEMRATLEEGD